MNTEWRKRADFAEYAEAVGVRTDQVAVVRSDPPQVLVVWTDNDDIEDRDAIVTVFTRDRDGLLVKQMEKPLPGFFDGIAEAMDEL